MGRQGPSPGHAGRHPRRPAHAPPCAGADHHPVAAACRGSRRAPADRGHGRRPPIHITSEIGKLKTVLLHRPGKELENLTPDYLTDLLFDDIPYLEVAQKEHDAFAQALRDHGVEVLYLDELVAEALSSDQLREQFVDEMLAASKQGSRRITQILRQFLLDLPTHAMVRKIMAGVRKDEITLPPEHQTTDRKSVV